MPPHQPYLAALTAEATPAPTSRPPVRILKDGNPITSVTDWGDRAPPKSADQWVKDRSAMTCAEEWLAHASSGGPPEILSLLASREEFREVLLDYAEPEIPLRFDRRRGTPRTTDLAVRGHDQAGQVAIAVEAKADESFGETVAQALLQGLEEHVKNPRSGKLARVDDLARSLFTEPMEGDPPLGDLRYQLLTACAGALAFAEELKATRAILIIHEYVTSATRDTGHTANAEDFRKFLWRVSRHEIPCCPPGTIVGPIQGIPGGPLFSTPVPLFVGKAVLYRRKSEVFAHPTECGPSAVV